MKRLSYAFFVCTCCMMCGIHVKAQDIAISFKNERGVALSKAKCYLYEYEGGRFKFAIMRDHPLPDDGVLVVKDAPKEWMVGVASNDRMYYRFWRNEEFDSKAKIELRLHKTAVAHLDFSNFPVAVKSPQRIAWFKKNTSGSYVLLAAGTFSKSNPNMVVGLGRGLYKFKLIGDGGKIIVESKDNKLIPGKVTIIKW